MTLGKTISKTTRRMLVPALSVVLLATTQPAAAQTPRANPTLAPVPPAAQQGPSQTKRVAWTAAGAGAGFGAGIWVGFMLFDDARYAERKIWTTAIVGAVTGGVIANLLSRPRQSSRSGSTTTLPVPSSATRSTVVAPIVGPRTVGFVFQANWND